MSDDACPACPTPPRVWRRHSARFTPRRCKGSHSSIAAVGVEAIGFAPWKHYWLGVMVTPWSMNLLLAPRDPGAWRPLPAGEKRRYTFPAGSFDFISAHADAIGEYLICSLFSPLLEFADHETARHTALLAREALFDSANAEAPELPVANSTPRRQMRPRAGPLAQLEASLATPMSRRDLLHARFPGTPMSLEGELVVRVAWDGHRVQRRARHVDAAVRRGARARGQDARRGGRDRAAACSASAAARRAPPPSMRSQAPVRASTRRRRRSTSFSKPCRNTSGAC